MLFITKNHTTITVKIIDNQGNITIIANAVSVEKSIPCRNDYYNRIIALDQQYAQCSITMENFIADLINDGVDTFVSRSGMEYHFFIKDKHVFIENKTTSQIEQFEDLHPHFQKRLVNYLFDQLPD